MVTTRCACWRAVAAVNMVVESLMAVEKLVEVELLTSVDFGAD
jgi:hypothetical protein